MGYKARNRKKVTLPSGATTAIRKLSLFALMEYGSMPTPEIDEDKSPNKPKRKKSEAEQKADLERGVKLARVALSTCVDPIEFEGEILTVVDKPSLDATQDELSIDDLDQEDAEFLFSSIMEFSGLGKEAGEKVRPFPEEQESSVDGSRDGEDLQGSADRDHAARSA